MDLNVRWMSILCFKQGVEKYWRKNVQQYVLLIYFKSLIKKLTQILTFFSGISEEEKTTLRKMLLENLSEPVPRLATQVSVIIGRVAR